MSFTSVQLDSKAKFRKAYMEFAKGSNKDIVFVDEKPSMPSRQSSSTSQLALPFTKPQKSFNKYLTKSEEESFCTRQKEYLKAKLRREDKLKWEVLKKEMSECTFVPQTGPKSQRRRSKR